MPGRPAGPRRAGYISVPALFRRGLSGESFMDRAVEIVSDCGRVEVLLSSPIHSAPAFASVTQPAC
jgi:hypothetical protein